MGLNTDATKKKVRFIYKSLGLKGASPKFNTSRLTNIFSTNCGSQFQSKEFIEALKGHGMWMLPINGRFTGENRGSINSLFFN